MSIVRSLIVAVVFAIVRAAYAIDDTDRVVCDAYKDPNDRHICYEELNAQNAGKPQIKEIKPAQPSSSFSPINTVMSYQCKKGGTIASYFASKINVPAVRDMGWSYEKTNNGYFVEKRIHVGSLRSDTIYRWHVTSGGKVTPKNGHAIGITK